jgi:hypothetical protein
MQHNTFECALFNVRWRVFFSFFFFYFSVYKHVGRASCADEFKRPPCTVIIMGEAKLTRMDGWEKKQQLTMFRPAAAANSCWVRRNLARLFGPLLMSRRERKTCGVHWEGEKKKMNGHIHDAVHKRAGTLEWHGKKFKVTRHRAHNFFLPRLQPNGERLKRSRGRHRLAKFPPTNRCDAVRQSTSIAKSKNNKI